MSPAGLNAGWLFAATTTALNSCVLQGDGVSTKLQPAQHPHPESCSLPQLHQAKLTHEARQLQCAMLLVFHPSPCSAGKEQPALPYAHHTRQLSTSLHNRMLHCLP